jgi:uncharacterized protein YggU (UPF0235/DUF167 family)
MTRFEVYVVPRATRPGPDGRHGGVPRLRVASPPTDGRANAEVERVLGRLLGCRVRLTGGLRSRRKRVEVALSSGEVERRLVRGFGPVL